MNTSQHLPLLHPPLDKCPTSPTTPSSSTITMPVIHDEKVGTPVNHHRDSDEDTEEEVRSKCADDSSSENKSTSLLSTSLVEEEQGEDDEEQFQESDQLVLRNVQVRIQKRPTTEQQQSGGFELVTLDKLVLRNPPTLESVREALTSSELGVSSRDIFFPAWTKSLYITWKSGGEVETIENDEQLGNALKKYTEFILLLQECRNARYSRRGSNGAKKHHYQQQQHRQYRVDRPIYFDRPTHYYVHPAAVAAAAYGCVLPPHAPAQYTDGSISFIPPPFIVPFMYSATHQQHQQ